MSNLTPSELEVTDEAFYLWVNDQRSYQANDTRPELANDVIFMGVGLASTGPSTVGTWSKPYFNGPRDFQVPQFDSTSMGQLVLTSSESSSEDPRSTIKVHWRGSTKRSLNGQVAILTALQTHRLSTKHGIPIFKNLRTLEKKCNKGPRHFPFSKGEGLTADKRAQAFNETSNLGVQQCKHLLEYIIKVVRSSAKTLSAQEEARHISLILASWGASAQHPMDKALARRINTLYARNNIRPIMQPTLPPRIVETKPEISNASQDLDDLLREFTSENPSPAMENSSPEEGASLSATIEVPVPCPSIDMETLHKLWCWFEEAQPKPWPKPDTFTEDLAGAEKIWEDTATSQLLPCPPMEANEGGAGPSILPTQFVPPSPMVDEGGTEPPPSPLGDNAADLLQTPSPHALHSLLNGDSDDLDNGWLLDFDEA